MFTSLLLLYLLSHSHQVGRSQESGQLSCLNEDGDPVDWYIAYKFPELHHQPAPFDSGHAYAYITSDHNEAHHSDQKHVPIPPKGLDSDSKSNERRKFSLFGAMKSIWKKIFDRDSSNVKPVIRRKRVADNEVPWIMSAKLITDPKSIVLRTLAAAYEKGSTLNSILYNDGPPKISGYPDHSTKAHAKGVVLMDDKSGKALWLTHSMPLFPPPVNATLQFEHNSKFYGQTFMCINFELKDAGKQVIDHLVNMNPLVYDSRVSSELRQLIPEIDNLKPESNKKRRKHDKSVTKLAQAIKTRAGQQLYLYSKSAAFGEDMYANWIDEELNADLYVATWRRGNGTPLNSSCPSDHHHVNNVQDFHIVDGDNKMSWSYLQDHSKWAISDNENLALVCISDVNRMKSQFKRGGGAVCIKCPSCWTAFSKTILDLQSCPTKQTAPQDAP